MPLPRRRRDRSAADGRAVDLRRQRPEHPRHHRPGEAERHALLRRPHPGRSGLDDHRLRAHALGPGAEAGTAHPQRRALPAPLRAGDAGERGEAAESESSGMIALLPNWIGGHAAYHPHGVQAAHIETLWWLMFWVCSAVFVAVMVALGAAITRPPRESGPPGAIPPERRERMRRVVAGAVGVTVLVLFVLLFASVSTGRAIESLRTSKAITIKLTGHQWWWEVEYDDPVPEHIVQTANEIHIPAGQPVRVELASADVIHSFWVPSLHG